MAKARISAQKMQDSISNAINLKLAAQKIQDSILLAEAIVAPTDIVKYFGEGPTAGNECEVAYNASLMALLWNSLGWIYATLMLLRHLKKWLNFY